MNAVITTINNPTSCVLKLASKLKEHNGKLVSCGDKGSPSRGNDSDEKWQLDCDTEFLSLDDQNKLPYHILKGLPEGHYSRKNVGYLRAMELGTKCVYETDDDNQPNEFWKPRESAVSASSVLPSEELRWVNAYNLFTSEHIWPRGLPLDKISESALESISKLPGQTYIAPIQQGLANVAPDVDAVWRLTQGQEFHFPTEQESFLLTRGNWCPFNTQSTWWWPDAYPLLYVPSYCPFRMCDIWKSFVAQRCLWEFAEGVVFHSPEVDQLRNPHNLMRDFEGEIQGYLRNNEIAETLHNLPLREGLSNLKGNLRKCYEVLVKRGVFPSEELVLLDFWIKDCERFDTFS